MPAVKAITEYTDIAAEIDSDHVTSDGERMVIFKISESSNQELLSSNTQKVQEQLKEQLGERGCETDVIGYFKPGNGRHSVEIHD